MAVILYTSDQLLHQKLECEYGFTTEDGVDIFPWHVRDVLRPIAESDVLCFQPFPEGQAGPGETSGGHYPSFCFQKWRTDEDSCDRTIGEEKKESGLFKEPESLEGAHDVYRDAEKAGEAGQGPRKGNEKGTKDDKTATPGGAPADS
ncbi:hypothetical protein NDU88_008536 [Pleurodeles waltl]|uniref:Uncharacterized protein n=1 Tax=Pleurodeles waltl TaxID=8319 RepID=A0AAV7NWC4_PLEWA|nr:hypothetical protein NDU88_008536 [Pleurodeles waltl]